MSLWIKGRISDPTGNFDPYRFSILQKNTTVIKIHQGKTKTTKKVAVATVTVYSHKTLKVIRVCLFTGRVKHGQLQITLQTRYKSKLHYFSWTKSLNWKVVHFMARKPATKTILWTKAHWRTAESEATLQQRIYKAPSHSELSDLCTNRGVTSLLTHIFFITAAWSIMCCCPESSETDTCGKKLHFFYHSQ